MLLSITHTKAGKANLTLYVRPNEQFNVIPSTDFDDYKINDEVINEFTV